MHRRTATIAVAAAFAIGAAFAAVPTSVHDDWGQGLVDRLQPWTPGTAEVMSARDPDEAVLAAPR